MMMLNDLLVVDTPPAKFTKALAVIASALHPLYDRRLPMPGKSLESCVLCSLTVRDFLWKVGFKDARLTTVYLVLEATDAAGETIHSAGCGDHNGPVPVAVPVPREDRGRWNGHVVVEVPSAGYIIDTTMFPMKRPAWPELPGMAALPVDHGGPQSYGLDHLAGIRSNRDDGSTFRAWWLRQPNPSWRDAPDASRKLRLPVVAALRTAFGNWRA
jgi:hypothetical protein